MYKPSENWVSCDICGFKRYASECRYTWNNLFVCADTCFEDKHPSLTPPKVPSDRIMAKNIRPPKEYFIEPPTEE